METFKPKISLEDVKDLTRDNTEIKNDDYYLAIDDLASKFKPNYKTDYESKWSYLYLPIEQDGSLICIDISVFLSHEKDYYLSFHGFSSGRYGAIIEKGNEQTPEIYQTVLSELERFLPYVRKEGTKLIEQLYPYEWRTGRIKRKHFVDPSKLISKEKAEKLKKDYQQHQETMPRITEISLNDYLKTADLCYRAGFPGKIKEYMRMFHAEEATPDFLRKCLADNRHGGMMFMEDPDSKKEYMDWYYSRKWEGAHPFEFVYSSNVHGMYLYPPDEKEPFYKLSVVDHDFNDAYLKMVETLIDNNIPFTTYNLEEIIKYATGEADIDVNTGSFRKPVFTYKHTKEEQEKYFKHITWDKLPILEENT